MTRIEVENPMAVDSYWNDAYELRPWDNAEIDQREDYLMVAGHAQAMFEEYMEGATSEEWECLYLALAKAKRDDMMRKYIAVHDKELADGYDAWYEEGRE